MTAGQTRARNLSTKHIQGAVQVLAGLALAAFPAFYLAIYARVAPIDNQGFLAVSLAVGNWVAVVSTAFVVESRLATPHAEKPAAMPRWLAAVSLAAGALLICGPVVAPPPILMVGVVGLMSGLLMARSIGVVSGRWKIEAAAAAILLVVSSIALLLAYHHNGNSVRVLALGAVLAISTRLWRAPRDGHSTVPPDLHRAAWVTGETAMIGFVQPALTSLILILLGPAASVTFRVVSTVSGTLEPILAYGRLRLLAHGHKGEVAIVAAIFGAGLAVIFGADFVGLWKLVFGPAWTEVTLAALLFACLWKGLMLVGTVPFAFLRRAGHAALVFWIRFGHTLIYLALGVAFVVAFRSPTAAFASFVVTELLSFVLYYFGAKYFTSKDA